MSNMSYCRFENTLADLRDYDEALEELAGCLDRGDQVNRLSTREARAARSMLALCRMMVERYGDVAGLLDGDSDAPEAV